MNPDSHSLRLDISSSVIRCTRKALADSILEDEHDRREEKKVTGRGYILDAQEEDAQKDDQDQETNEAYSQNRAPRFFM